jgi:hypothetical protein
MDKESLQRIVKKLSNELIDMKKSSGEGSSSPNKVFRFPPKKHKTTPSSHKTNSFHIEGINMEDIFQALQMWEIKNMNEVNDEREENQEQHRTTSRF